MKFLTLLIGALAGAVSVSGARIQRRCDQEPPPSSGNGTFTNPVIYSDFPDNDVFLGPDGAYYFSASNFHFSPGAPILRSMDLVNWDIIGHSIPRHTWSEGYDLPPANPGEDPDSAPVRYRYGTWASSMRYRPSNKLWYWIGCVNFWNSPIFTASDPAGPWKNEGIIDYNGTCYYDNGILIDDDDTMYVVFGNSNIRVAQLDPSGTKQVRMQTVFTQNDVGAGSLEGNRFYKINGLYYILNDQPGGETYIWKSKNVWGPYEAKMLIKDVVSPVPGGNSPHQGSLIETRDGNWYYMSFTWAYPAGRMPVLAPVTWGADGYPVFVKGANGGWGVEYPLPHPDPTGNTQPKKWDRTDTFTGAKLDPSWEWNHNPDESAYQLRSGGGLTLRTASVTDNIYRARNTLTHRTHGIFPRGTVQLDISGMIDGDRAGLAAFRDQTGYLGVHRGAGEEVVLAAMQGAWMDEWSGLNLTMGETVASKTLPVGTEKIWFRVDMDARATGDTTAEFAYSLDGKAFELFGPTYQLYRGWAFFVAYRFGIFNYATKELGGSVVVKSFTAE
ncbi:glycosyl hydrolase [Plectosphaerella plurivora]|uniref:Glycosyl hydrolase n=1 Tax=Plectosphaerella plurivora TaxID=936078 RepID=A0A9P8VBV5_9PEZI|nr:glycosyl hydrolase [Plectosphaerella plurivora]